MVFSLSNTIKTTPFQTKGLSPRPKGLNIKPCRVNCAHSDSQDEKERTQGDSISRRNILVGLGGLCGMAPSILNKSMTANAANEAVYDEVEEAEDEPMQPVSEFGPNPRPLDQVIRVLVDVPKMKKESVILRVDDITIPNSDPVRFDVYIAEPVGNFVSADYGEYIGSEVDLAHLRNDRKARLELGITYMLQEMGAEDTDKLVATLVPRTGTVIIGGVSVYTA